MWIASGFKHFTRGPIEFVVDRGPPPQRSHRDRAAKPDGDGECGSASRGIGLSSACFRFRFAAGRCCFRLCTPQPTPSLAAGAVNGISIFQEGFPLGLSATPNTLSIYAFVRSGHIPANLLGRGRRAFWRFFKHELLDWLDTRAKDAVQNKNERRRA